MACRGGSGTDGVVALFRQEPVMTSSMVRGPNADVTDARPETTARIARNMYRDMLRVLRVVVNCVDPLQQVAVFI